MERNTSLPEWGAQTTLKPCSLYERSSAFLKYRGRYPCDLSWQTPALVEKKHALLRDHHTLTSPSRTRTICKATRRLPDRPMAQAAKKNDARRDCG